MAKKTKIPAYAPPEVMIPAENLPFLEEAGDQCTVAYAALSELEDREGCISANSACRIAVYKFDRWIDVTSGGFQIQEVA